jgi:prolyl-tRNA editing enzyme YbaK/EbsC (Cys-tRNA(Pro) deacylase)
VKSAVDVHNFLVERNVAHEMVPTGGRVRSPERVAAVLGLVPEQVGRVVVFEGEDSIVAALVPADRVPDADLVSEAYGSRLSQVSSDRAIDLTEFLPEALPPVALPDATSVLMDRDLAEQEVLYFPGGEATSVLKIRAEDLIQAAAVRVAPLSR